MEIKINYYKSTDLIDNVTNEIPKILAKEIQDKIKIIQNALKNFENKSADKCELTVEYNLSSREYQLYQIEITPYDEIIYYAIKSAFNGIPLNVNNCGYPF